MHSLCLLLKLLSYMLVRQPGYVTSVVENLSIFWSKNAQFEILLVLEIFSPSYGQPRYVSSGMVDLRLYVQGCTLENVRSTMDNLVLVVQGWTTWLRSSWNTLVKGCTAQLCWSMVGHLACCMLVEEWTVNCSFCGWQRFELMRVHISVWHWKVMGKRPWLIRVKGDLGVLRVKEI